MKKFLLTVAVLVAILVSWSQTREMPGTPGISIALADEIEQAFQNRTSNIQVTGEGRVAKLLPDDKVGSRHQRFILRLASGQTVLVAHNIDLAPRLDSIKSGDSISFHGVYEWSPQGGVIHWTHLDPSGRHSPGWLKHAGKTVQ